MPKKYLVFSFWDYYPTGGWDDQIIDATTQEYLHGGLVFQLKQGIKDEE